MRPRSDSFCDSPSLFLRRLKNPMPRRVASRRTCIVRPVSIRALNRSASRKGKASARKPDAASFHAESKKLEKVDAMLHTNQVPDSAVFHFRDRKLLIGPNSRKGLDDERRV